jgi:coenzyme PQQ precursor peptide PqqA
MQWTKPDFQEITLGMEVTAYVNTDADTLQPLESPKQGEVNTSNPVPTVAPDSGT